MSRVLLAAGVLLVPLLNSSDSEPATAVFGLVADPNGFPVAGVRIDHTGAAGASPVTDREGRFRFETSAPLIVFRKDGYQSRAVRLTRRPLRIMLRPAFRELPPCPADAQCADIGGMFCFPVVPGVEVGGVSLAAGRSLRTFLVDGSGPELLHGFGAGWEMSRPRDQEVWRSARYSEVTYRVANRSVLSIRGITASGTQWRFFGIAGESAGYRESDASRAALLDRVIDGVCLRGQRR